MDQHPRHIVAVSGAFRNDDDRILLVKTRDKGWMMPGGQVEPGENLVEAVIRETQEEASCTVAVEGLAAVYTNPQPSLERVMFTFVGRYCDGKPQGDGKETLEAGFFTENEALEKLRDAQRDQLLDTLNRDGHVIYRVYTTRPYQVVREWKLDIGGR